MKFIAVLLLSTLVAAQDSRPKLELEPKLNLNDLGFQPFSESLSGGVGMEMPHFSWHFSGTYGNAKKTNDGTLNNRKGNERSVGGEVYYRLGAWMFGGEYGYGELRTTNYKKTGHGYSYGGGKDFDLGDGTLARLIVNYDPPSEPVYRIQGFSAHFMVPSPMESDRHVFFDEYVTVGWLHQSGHLDHHAETSFGILFRF